MDHTTALLLAMCLDLALQQSATNREVSVQMDHIEHCKDAKGLNKDGSYIIQYVNPYYSRRNGTHVYFMRGKIIITENVDGFVWLSVLMVKCVRQDVPDTCETYMQFRRDDLCDNLDAGSWAAFYQSFSKEGLCPLIPGTYNIKNSEIDTSHLNYLPTSEGYWKFRVEMRNSSGLLNCINTYFRIVSASGTRRSQQRIRNTSTTPRIISELLST